MRGLMHDSPLLISSLIRHAARVFGDQELVTRSVEGPIHRTNYRELHLRAQQLAGALVALGVQPGDRVATLAWNTSRHVEVYFAVSGIGAVCHTLNPRLPPEQLCYILNHAGDVLLFVDLSFVPFLARLGPNCPALRKVIVLSDRAHLPADPDLLAYEDLLAEHPQSFAWPSFDENTASSLCYTSGTTGEPKGVLYSHRSTLLHSFAIALPDLFNLGEHETVLPGPKLDGESVYQLLEDERVTMTAGVPTVWMMLLNYMQQHGKRFSTLKRVIVGGSAAPEAMIRTFQDQYGVELRHAWGMTETSPLGSFCSLTPAMKQWPKDEQVAVQRKQGRPAFGVELRIVDDAGVVLPETGEVSGDLQIRGPWVCSGYYEQSGESPTHHPEGWFSTGDVATLDPAGFMQITDRSKDVIKSGGEWISSITLENLAMGHPAVAEAAVIGVAHPRWLERPSSSSSSAKAPSSNPPTSSTTSPPRSPAGGAPTPSSSSTPSPTPPPARSPSCSCASSSRTTSCPTSPATPPEDR